MNVYLDWAATSVPDPDICRKVSECSTEFYGNPSSQHQEGQKASRVLEESRERCARALGVKASEIIFTSGGTESNNMVLLSFLRKPSRGTVILSPIEHPAILEPAEVLREAGYRIKFIKPEPDGIITVQTLEKALTEDTRLVTVMAVNNETGAIQPVSQLADAVHRYAAEHGRKIHFHCDAVQGTGKVSIDFSDSNIHSFSISGHKLRGPRGIGILVLKNQIQCVVQGGHQESGIRPGTENTPAIFGMSLALEQAMTNLDRNISQAHTLMDGLISRLSQDQAYTIIPQSRPEHPEKYSPYIISLAAVPVPGEIMARVLDDSGFCVGTGSACSNRKKSLSKTLEAMKVPEETSFSRIRVSIGYTTLQEDLESFMEALDRQSRIMLKTYRK